MMWPMRRFNLSEPNFTHDPTDPEGFRAGLFRMGPDAGAKETGTSLYELPPGQALCPYHYEYGEEEWMLVVEGRPHLRTPEGTEQLDQLDVVFFPKGPEGGHKIWKRDRRARASPDVVLCRLSDRDGVPGQRQGRHLDPRQGRGPDGPAFQWGRVLRRRDLGLTVLSRRSSLVSGLEPGGFMKRIWPRTKRPPRTVYVGSYEDKLSRLGAVHVDPDDDGRTREDVHLQKTEGRPPAGVTRGFMA